MCHRCTHTHTGGWYIERTTDYRNHISTHRNYVIVHSYQHKPNYAKPLISSNGTADLLFVCVALCKVSISTKQAATTQPIQTMHATLLTARPLVYRDTLTGNNKILSRNAIHTIDLKCVQSLPKCGPTVCTL